MTNVYLVMWLENRKQKQIFRSILHNTCVFNLAILFSYTHTHTFKVCGKGTNPLFLACWGLWGVFVPLCGHMFGWDSREGKERAKLNNMKSSVTVICDVKRAPTSFLPFLHWRPFCLTGSTAPFVYKTSGPWQN